ncbi:MAG: sigma-54-dependent Fis family transcriptional regulator [Deltaproteobacteria bacterium]|nr:sigma-54-dependent Fis family transcriptional regulator [Deltaproteobacteria bacterium]
MGIPAISPNSPFAFESISQSAIFFVMDEKCNILSMSGAAKEKCRLNDNDIARGVWCDAVLDGFPLYDCPPKSFGVSSGNLKTANGKMAGTFIYYPIKDEKGRIVGSIWNFIRQSSSCCNIMEDESFWATKNKTMGITIQRAIIAAKKDSPISIFGETGTGKTVLAKFIHQQSQVREGPFIHINCSTIPETLFESELFGYEKGAFTGANTEEKGYIAAADGGTLFLDEVADMPLTCQSKLLTFLDTKRYQPLGATKERINRVRIISSSNKPLWEMTKNREFRQDLFFRLSVIRLFMPPLRERKEDIPTLVNNFLGGKKRISSQAMRLILSHPWHGNIRELTSVLESACVCSADEEIIQPDHLCLNYEENETNGRLKNGMTNPDDEKYKILLALKNSSNNKTMAAQLLGLSRITLWRKMKKHGLEVSKDCGADCSCHK